MSQVVLILGASSGIGKAIAAYLSEQGNTVVMVARREEKLAEIASTLKTKGYYYPYDLQNLEEIESIFQFCKQSGLMLDGMVYCAGINRDLPIRANDIAVMKEVMNVNYMAFVEAGKYFGRKKYSVDASSIVAISSIGVSYCNSGMSTYISSKNALNATVRVMAKEYMKRGIRVNAILPNFVDTEMAHNIDDYTESLEEKVRRIQPLGIIEPIQVAYLTEFLLSEQAKFITGAEVPISGGYV